VIPFIIVKKKIDIVHSLHYSFPVITLGAKKFVTIHDMTFFKFPEYHEILKRYFFRIFIHLAAKMADRIITPSESTAKDFALFTNAQKDKISVIHLGSVNWPTSSFPRKKTEIVKKKYEIKGEYLLYVGMIEPRKNVPNLILAYEKLSKVNKNYHLVIVGQKGWGYGELFKLIDDFKLQDRIIFTGFVEGEDKFSLIKGAKAFVYPSMYEGFGLPVLEALSLGVPTVTSNASSLPEVAGEAALLVDPTNVDELYVAIKKLLDDKKIYQELKQKAVLQAAKFSWTRTAEKTIKVYHSIAS
jgi:glycosyltransferase involved in cell wall biosynthesis